MVHHSKIGYRWQRSSNADKPRLRKPADVRPAVDGSAWLVRVRSARAANHIFSGRPEIFHATLWAIDLKRRRQWRDGPLAAAYR
jgi:hypothetical protein